MPVSTKKVSKIPVSKKQVKKSEVKPEPSNVVTSKVPKVPKVVQKIQELTESINNAKEQEDVKAQALYESDLVFYKRQEEAQHQIDFWTKKKAELEEARKNHMSLLRGAIKKKKKSSTNDKENSSSPRKPSGITEPLVVSDDMYKYLQKSHNIEPKTPISRTHLTSLIRKDIKNHNLVTGQEVNAKGRTDSVFKPSKEMGNIFSHVEGPLFRQQVCGYIGVHFPTKN